MKSKQLLRTLAAFCTALVLMGGFSVPAYAGGGEEPADGTNDSNVQVEQPEETPPLTPDGNATLVDDYGGNKQLITVTTKNGKALLDAKNRNGQRNAALETFGDNRQSYNARKLVAEFFGVTEYEIRKAVKLTQLIPELSAILEDIPKQLNLACADLVADYDTESQKAFIEICSIEGYQLNKAAMQHITRKCPPPTADRQAVFAAWREARDAAEKRLAAPPRKISFDRKQFAPYLDQFSNDREIEKLFLEFLQERAKVS